MFTAEGSGWYGIPEFNLLDQNITIPGFSPLFPQAHCTLDGSICHLVTGEGEINAASTMTALVYSPVFNLTQTYFFVAGIGGISPKRGTLGSVTFPRFAVHVGLQYEFDAREKPDEWPTGYVPQGSFAPNQYPQTLYGTEVYELNDALRQATIQMAQTATLNDNTLAQEYRANYASNPAFAPGAAPPSVVACDTATSDTFWTGTLLAEAFENTTSLFTNGSATYCTTQQEDNATLGALLRGAVSGLVDFSRIIIMRTASNFDRQHDGQTAVANRFAQPMAGFALSVQNIQAAGIPVVTGIVSEWDATFQDGVQPTNYVGDIYASLGGTPDFGPASASAI
ncbi:purine nucleoside permease [Lentinus tigrinus ALCF2SS1-6]|uniref:Purine nucleoside permease n=1 Tax=Lentinus tigrinus ALCF2SS1-6 TaxID=1328759 RepID=A0A5C2RQ01_9APHY|nr:purine nucleoside permease [Lentinus tigrinus ALCF2SS1-6]